MKRPDIVAYVAVPLIMSLVLIAVVVAVCARMCKSTCKEKSVGYIDPPDVTSSGKTSKLRYYNNYFYALIFYCVRL